MRKARVEELFKQAQHEWGLTDYNLIFYKDKDIHDWFGANSGVVGYCNHHTKVIGLWEPYVKYNEEVAVKDTLMHEVAHALSESDHDSIWEDMCKMVGAVPDPIACSKGKVMPIPVFGTYWFSRFACWIERYFFTMRCHCFKCTWGVDKY